MARFSKGEWKKIFAELERHSDLTEPFGMPKRRRDSVVLSSFNIRALGNADTRTANHEKGRTQGAWDFLARYVSQCDFVAIQEVKDDLSGIRRLKESLRDSEKYAIVVSDVTGARPGLDVTQERLAFLYRWDRIERTELASDITYDRRSILDSILSHWDEFKTDFDKLDKALTKFNVNLKKHKDGTLEKKPKKPPLVLSNFLTFIRTPHVASFLIKGPRGSEGLPFLGVNAHLLYGDKSKSREERKMEFAALVDWLRWRTRSGDRLYHTNMIAFGDMNLEFDKNFKGEDEADQAIKDMNKKVGRGYTVNFPFLDTPARRKDKPIGDGKGRFRSTARMTETYDQIGFFGKDEALPVHGENDEAGRLGVNAFNYGVFVFADLFAKALHNADGFRKLQTRKSFVKRFEHDVSDHHPIWVRLPKPRR